MPENHKKRVEYAGTQGEVVVHYTDRLEVHFGPGVDQHTIKRPGMGQIVSIVGNGGIDFFAEDIEPLIEMLQEIKTDLDK